MFAECNHARALDEIGRELSRRGFDIERERLDNNPPTPAFIISKQR